MRNPQALKRSVNTVKPVQMSQSYGKACRHGYADADENNLNRDRTNLCNYPMFLYMGVLAI